MFGLTAVPSLLFFLGMRHATDSDHVIAVSAIVSEDRNVLRSALVGGLWGAGHTASLVIVGVLVLVFRVAIPRPVANWLEFGVALMIIALGVLAVARALRRRSDVHLHRHKHDGQSHVHVHFHEHGTEHSKIKGSESTHSSHSHAIARVGFKPLLVGAMHGLAGSAALTLLVLTQIQSVWLGSLYLALFGVGSTLGMLLMSGLIGLPFALSARRRLSSSHYGLQTVAGALSIAFGVWYAYETAVVTNLWRTMP